MSATLEEMERYNRLNDALKNATLNAQKNKFDLELTHAICKYLQKQKRKMASIEGIEPKVKP